MKKPRIGLLALYLELYDTFLPDVKTEADRFYRTIAEEFAKKGVDAATAPICRLESEFQTAVASFERQDVDALVTLHLAYSPSLESARALSATPLPLIILDTTPDYDFDPEQDSGKIMYNHGIHGVQDLCNLLIRSGKPFQIEAGHWQASDVIDRVIRWAGAAQMARTLGSMRVGLIGESFRGMGDFYLPPEALRDQLGITVVPFQSPQSWLSRIGEGQIQAEMEQDGRRFATAGLDPAVFRKTIHTGLAIRQWIAAENLTAWTFNFLNIDQDSGLPAVPFLEASKSLARGLGYAGEGDALTAALVAALASRFPETSFVEMFCPDWRNQAIFISHMGELNLDLAAAGSLSLQEAEFPYTDIGRPVIAYGRYKAGAAVLVNLAPGPDRSFSLIISKIDMLEAKKQGQLRPVRARLVQAGL